MKEAVLTRRRFIQVGMYGGAVLLIPAGAGGCGNGEGGLSGQGPVGPEGPAAEQGRFFNAHQYETVQALTGAIVPEDEDPGAVSAGVVDYIDFLLGAFKVNPPRIYAAGPFSGRHGGGGHNWGQPPN